MATAKKGSYEAGITRSSEDLQKEQVVLRVQEAKDNLETGILSMKAELIKTQSSLRTATSSVTLKENALNKAKFAVPFSTQGLLDARTAWLQSKEDLVVAEDAHKQTQEAHDYLEATQKELF